MSSLKVYNRVGGGDRQTDQWSTAENQMLMIQPAACSEWYRNHREVTLEQTGTHRSNRIQNSPQTSELEWQNTTVIILGRLWRRILKFKARLAYIVRPLYKK